MPQSVDGFDGGWNHVLDEMACLSRQLLPGHVFMLAKHRTCSARLWPVQSRDAVRNHTGTDGTELASQKQESPVKERGIVWKNVSKG